MSILQTIMDYPLSLYLHIPFCVHRCAYCDFNTYAGIDDKIPDYIRALCQEIRFAGKAASQYYGNPVDVHTVFLGGGTPSLLGLPELTLVISELREAFRFTPDIEMTLEANPGTLDQNYLHGLFKLGINRLSLGMQSAHIDDLRILERSHNLEDVVQAVRWSRQAGFKNLNLDLIFGIPHQSFESWKSTLDMVLGIYPEHLSLYALTLEHGTPMHRWIGRGLLPEPDQDLAADMYEYAMDRLECAGYFQYEISNWARQDKEGVILSCQHNLQYWRMLPYLGFGAGAHGFAAGVRTANVLSPLGYIKRLESIEPEYDQFPHTPATVDFISIDRIAEMGEMMMMGLRLVQEGISEVKFLHRFGQPLQQVFEKQIHHLTQSGLLEWAGDRETDRALRLTKRGRLLGNRVFREFI